MGEIIVRFPTPLAIFTLVAWLPLSVFVAVGSTLMTLFLHTMAGTMPVWKIAAGYVFFPMMVFIGVSGVFIFFLYARVTLFTTFRVTEDGIHIENRRYGLLALPWSEIEAARYSRSLKIVVLKSRKLMAPIAIMSNAQSESTGFQPAVVQIKKNVGARWVATWLWP